MQRTGTTSIGDFFRSFNYKVAGYSVSKKNKWSYLYSKGDFESIFNSKDFKSSLVFEDDPWWLPEFYKVLYHRFPGSKFILFIRDSDAWFESMMKHSDGKTLGNTKLHSKIYRREKEFYDLLSEQELLDYNETVIDNLLELKNHKEQYKELYEIRNKEIIQFFQKENVNSLFIGQLEDPDKWKKLAAFFKLNLPEAFHIHSNQSKKVQ